MTPTLSGRWQTRIVLLWTIGLLITLLYMWVFGAFQVGTDDPSFWVLLKLLGYVTLLGFGWDILYNYFQSLRWDRDWPLAYHFIAGIWEGVVVFALFALNLLPSLTYHSGDWSGFLLHYGTIWFVTYWWVFGPMRVIVPRWRFNGGEFIS